MNARLGIVIVLLSLYGMCTWDSKKEYFSAEEIDSSEVSGLSAENTGRYMHYVDIMQRLCALEVVHRHDVIIAPHVFEGFADKHIEDDEPQGVEKVLACVQMTRAVEDSTVVILKEF